MSLDNPHDKAMDLAENAVIAKLKKDFTLSKELFKNAYGLEIQEAIKYLHQHDYEPTRSVLFRSAAALALSADLFNEAEKAICMLLIGNPPDDIAIEARHIYENINFHRHLSITGVKLTETEMQLSLVGNSVSFGMVKATEFNKRAGIIDTLAIRSAERLLNRPFREKGRIPSDIRESFETYYSVPRAASFAITLRVGYKQRQLDLFEDNLQSKVVCEIIENMKIINNGDEKFLRKKMDNDDYFYNTIGLIKKIAPDNEEVSMVGLSTLRNDLENNIAFTRLRNEIKISPITNTDVENYEELIVTGALNYASADNHDIKLLSSDGTTYKIIVPKGILGDIVKPYWEQIVTIKGKLKDKKIYYEDLWKDEENA